MKRIVCIVVPAVFLATCVTAAADCMGNFPRYAELKVESCVSAAPLVQSAIEGKEYSPSELQLVKLSAEHLYIIHAQALAEMDLIEWRSHGSLRRYVGKREPIESKPRDYLVISYGGCADLPTGKPLIFDINPEKPCRDMIVVINGKQAAETDARLILDLPEVSYDPDQEQYEDIASARKRLQEKTP